TTYTPPTPTLTDGGFYNNNDPTDKRPRLLQAMLNVNDGEAFSYITGDVQDTSKTINMMNGTRRLNSLTQIVNMMPGQITATLINNTDPAAVTRSLVYMTNNLDDDETGTAKAFASMIHYGTKIVAQGRELEPYDCNCTWTGCDTCLREYVPATPTCLEFTAIGPRRMAAVLNLEAGPYLEALLSGLGWQISIAAMNCGWARDDGDNSGAVQCTSFPDRDNASGGMLKDVGDSYNGVPKPTARQCIPAREITAGYKYGNYTWGASNEQGIRWQNCQSIMPWKSGGSFIATAEGDTDNIIWNGLSAPLGLGTIEKGIGQ
ncbi:MAG TPA: hypothetical protein PLY93_13655, partial [Turneriella sp.]|nr:hypothetical protein [Turneriella sp.]